MRDPRACKKAVVFLTSHFHSPLARKTDIHFLAEAFWRNGCTTDIVTVGQSLAKQLLKPSIGRLARSVQRGNAGHPVGGYITRELVHPLSGAQRWLELASAPLLATYGWHLDRTLRAIVGNADLVLVEAGYASLYHAALVRAAPRARFGCLLNDDLVVVGFRQAVVWRALATMPRFQFVRVPAQALLRQVPAGCHAIVIPHGVEKHVFDRSARNPYAAHRRNVVSVGNMLFDADAVRAMAQHRPDVDFHVIGASLDGPRPANIIVHGELAFEQAAPYIKFADVGLAAYRHDARASYLAESSMKLLQYSYCGLPVLLPNYLNVRRRNAVCYAPADLNSIAGAVDRALSHGNTPHAAEGILDWSEIADRLMREAFQPCNNERKPEMLPPTHAST
jgi:2-beta-glucuronyltransferase